MSVLKIGDQITAESVFPEGTTGYFDVFEMAEDGSRRVTKRAAAARAGSKWHERRNLILIQYERPILWAARGLPTSRVGPAVGQYAPYPVDPTNLLAIQTPPSNEPVNNVPWTFGWRELNWPENPEQGGFLKHACTFAYEMGRSYSPFAYMMGEEAHFDMQPLTPHSDESNHRNRVGLRYWRCLVGAAFRKFERFEVLEPEGDPLISTRDWRTRLPLMQELDAYLCDTCHNHTFDVHDFIEHLVVNLWDAAFDQVLTNEVGGLYQRLPKIDRSNPNLMVPHATENVDDFGVSASTARSNAAWKGLINEFTAARKRYTRDARVRG